MKIDSQLMRRSCIAAAAVVALLSIPLGWRLFHDANVSRFPWNADFVASHAAHARAELEKIHRGAVDAAELDRIVETAEAPEAGGAQFDSTDRFAVAQYLTDHDSHSAAAMTKVNFEVVSAAEADAAAAIPDDRSFVGQKVCETCHQQEAKNWAHTIHAAVFTINPRNADEAKGCESCHGPGSAHIKNPSDLTTIISFSHKSKTPVALQNAQCLSCHKGGERIFWHGSIHENNNLSCSDCHNPMADFSAHGLTARESASQTCFSCHKVQRAEFNERSHMPLLEGKISCVDCHNPHGSTTAPLLKADSVNDVCYGCHAEKRGPFLFEHAPVRESCLNCHNPHGSNFESLLNAPRPMLCQQCHAQNGHPAQLMTRGNLAGGPMPDPRLIATSCQTCHVNIHGSNDPSGARFER
jgi:DmsE family decaheme c-type cytochrome